MAEAISILNGNTMNSLYPISATMPNWEYVKTAFADILNQNIDSGILINRLDKDLGSYIGILGLENSPLEEMRKAAKSSLKHVSISFAMHVEYNIMLFITSYDIKVTLKQKSPESYFMICTGSIDDWLVLANDACQKDKDYELRLLFNKIIIYFDNIGLKQIVDNFDKIPYKDRTFTLKRNV